MRKPLLLLLFLFAATCGIMAWIAPFSHPSPARAAPAKPRIPHSAPTLSLASEALQFARVHHFNTSFCFMADMHQPSGRNRFFVLDLKKDSIVEAGLVAHGNCNQYWLEGRKYSNVPGCGCTSLGRYRIGKPYIGRFGLAFKLYGLEKTNDKAFDRYVVLHSYADVPEKETRDEICESNGCPMVAPGFLKKLAVLINASEMPMLLWIYDSSKQ